MAREHMDRQRRSSERPQPCAPEPAAQLRLHPGASNAAIARLLAGRRTTDRQLQRMIGFELESGAWQSALLARPPSEEEKASGDIGYDAAWDPPDARKAFYDAGNIRGTADELPGRQRDVEFVIKAQDESAEGAIGADFDRVGAAFGAMRGKLTGKHWMWPERKLGWKPPDEGTWLLDNPSGDATVQLQATAGVPLEQLAEMMAGLDTTAPEGDEVTDPRKQASIATAAAAGLAEAQGAADTAVGEFASWHEGEPEWQDVSRLRGLMGLMAQMIIGGKPPSGKADTPEFSYPKAIAAILPRTDFANLFRTLPEPQQLALAAPFPHTPTQTNFVTLVSLLCDLNGLGDIELPLLGWTKWTQITEGQIAPDLTRQAWAEGILAGQDRLSQSGYLAWLESRKVTITEQEYADRQRQSKQLDSMGAWKDRMDDRDGEKLPLVEFRALVLASQNTAMTVEQARDVGLKLAAYVNRLASR
jgi:hypothetical protein